MNRKELEEVVLNLEKRVSALEKKPVAKVTSIKTETKPNKIEISTNKK